MTNGDRVRHLYSRVKTTGVVSFTRSGFARVRWLDGRVSDEWVADLTVIEDDAEDGAAA